ncbi:MAG: hypothetical protein ACI4T5_10845 [Prevotella sp.]
MRDKVTIIISLVLAMTVTGVAAQTFRGESNFDGKHHNEASGFLQAGDNIITGFFAAFNANYKYHFDKRWSVEGAAGYQTGKQQVSVYAKGAYHFSLGYSDFYISPKLMYNRYCDYRTNEYAANLSATWETPYFDLTVGESLITYSMLGSSYTEPLTLTFGTGVNIRPRWNSWNIGVFFRNYDEFYYENWNINWGFRFYAGLKKDFNLFGELNIRPAGSMSQLASKYETTLRIGVRKKW